MRKAHALIHDETFHLVEHRRVSLIRIAAIHATRGDDLDRRTFSNHRSDLHGRRVRAEQIPAREVEGVVHCTRRVIVGDIQRREVMEVVFDFRPRANAESCVLEDLLDPQHGSRNRMVATD